MNRIRLSGVGALVGVALSFAGSFLPAIELDFAAFERWLTGWGILGGLAVVLGMLPGVLGGLVLLGVAGERRVGVGVGLAAATSLWLLWHFLEDLSGWPAARGTLGLGAVAWLLGSAVIAVGALLSWLQTRRRVDPSPASAIARWGILLGALAVIAGRMLPFGPSRFIHTNMTLDTPPLWRLLVLLLFAGVALIAVVRSTWRTGASSGWVMGWGVVEVATALTTFPSAADQLRVGIRMSFFLILVGGLVLLTGGLLRLQTARVAVVPEVP